MCFILLLKETKIIIIIIIINNFKWVCYATQWQGILCEVGKENLGVL